MSYLEIRDELGLSGKIPGMPSRDRGSALMDAIWVKLLTLTSDVGVNVHWGMPLEVDLLDVALCVCSIATSYQI